MKSHYKMKVRYRKDEYGNKIFKDNVPLEINGKKLSHIATGEIDLKDKDIAYIYAVYE